MSFTLKLPPPVDAELIHEARRAGVSEDEQAALLVCLATALQQDAAPTLFQEAVRIFLSYHSLNAEQVSVVFKELIKVCLNAHDAGKASPLFQQTLPNAMEARHDYAPLTQWREAFVHGAIEQPVHVRLESAILDASSPPAILQSSSGRERERDPELVARVKALRGKYAHTAGESGSEELHRERQRDKRKEEMKVQERQP